MSKVPIWIWLHVPVGLLVALFGMGEVGGLRPGAGQSPLLVWCLVAIALGAAVALHQRLPAVALGLIWTACAAQMLAGIDLMLVNFALIVVAYGVARYGSAVTLWLSLVSIPIGYAIAAGYLPAHSVEVVHLLALRRFSSGALPASAIFALAAAAALVLPWLVGFAVRMRDRAVAARAESIRQERARIAAEQQRAQAQQLADMRDEQARLARDVHDVVGHSLAVILAQAESGHYLPDDDPARLKQTMANIAGSARNSLRDVREILAATGGVTGTGGESTGELDRLIDDVREAGVPIDATVVGTDRPLPPDLAVVAYRVLQEMLTNTLKHGRPGEPVLVTRRWDHGLTIEVTNTPLARAPDPPPEHGAPREGTPGPEFGVAGMRQRLSSVRGTLSVTQTAETYIARAWLPTSGRLREPAVPGQPQPAVPGPLP